MKVSKNAKVTMSCGCVYKDIKVKCQDKRCKVCVKKVSRSVKAWGFKDRVTKRLIPVAKQSRKFAEKRYDYIRYKIVRVIIKEIV